MNIKMFEIRDVMTFIPVLCVEMRSDAFEEEYLLHRLGFDNKRRLIQLVWIGNGKTEYDPFKWNDRTFHTAHKFIEENWDDLKTGAVIDVEFILGESETIKISERE